MTCPQCSGVGCPTCEGSGVVAESVTFAQACELVWQSKQSGQPFHFRDGRPKLVVINGEKLRIVA